jgi:hypothetical protein
MREALTMRNKLLTRLTRFAFFGYLFGGQELREIYTKTASNVSNASNLCDGKTTLGDTCLHQTSLWAVSQC